MLLNLFEQLKRDVETGVLVCLERLGWDATILSENGSPPFMVISASKDGIDRKFVFISATAIKHEYYAEFSKTCDKVYYNGNAYKIDDYRKGAPIEVKSIKDFFSDMVDENRAIQAPRIPKFIDNSTGRIDVVSEDILKSLYQQLERFSSAELSRKFISARSAQLGVDLSPSALSQKATGVAFSVRQGLQYFKGSGRSLSAKIISLYYGTMSFAFAEILASPHGSNSLLDLENITKKGHGLYTIPSENGNFEEIWVGVLNQGFFSKWAKFRGYDPSQFPGARIKTPDEALSNGNDFCIRIGALFANFPEIETMFRELFSLPNNWVFPFPPSLGGPHVVSGSTKHKSSSYFNFYDSSLSLTANSFARAHIPVSEVREVNNEEDPLDFSKERYFQGHLTMTALTAHGP